MPPKLTRRYPSLTVMTSVAFLSLICILYFAIFNNIYSSSLEDAPVIVPEDDDFRIPFINDRVMGTVETVYVIPGGGSGDSSEGGYPEWTKQRVNSAFEHYRKIYFKANEKSDERDKGTAIFLALSAGSLNAPNAQYSDGRIKFECQHIIKHLKELGVPKDIIFGDQLSWDTVGNGLTLRLVLEAVQLYRKKATMLGDNVAPEKVLFPRFLGGAIYKQHTHEEDRTKPLAVEVFISDFHASRVQATFEWILGLRPALTNIDLRINSVSSKGSQVTNAGDFSQRIEHEEEGVHRIRENAKNIKTIEQFYGFYFLGGHQGLFKYLQDEYVKSTGAGW